MDKQELIDLLFPIWRTELGIDDVQTVSAPHGSPNFHFAGLRGGDKVCFLKTSFKRGINTARERAVCAWLSALGYHEQTLLGNGQVGEDITWLAFPWIEHTSFAAVDAAELQAAGRTLGELHRRTQGGDAPEIRRFTLTGELNRQLDKLAPLAPKLHEELTARVRLIHDQLGDWEDYEDTLPVVLLHGDFGWRNYVRKSDGQLALIDYEHAAFGPCWMDLCKAVDRELASPDQMQWFQAGYADTFGAEMPALADSYLLGMRLWMVAGIYVFTSKYPDPAFQAHGDKILDAYDTYWKK